MHSSIFMFAAMVASAAASPQSTTPLALGAICSSSSQCQTGVSCYAVNSMLEPRCGNAGATCTLGSQCVTGSCESGECSFTASSTTSASSTSSTPIPSVIPVGSVCTPGGTSCANGAQCYAVSSGLTTICGNLGSTCSSNSQCAFNNCVSGTCSGPTSISSSTTTTSGSISTSSSQVTPTSSVIPLGGTCVFPTSTCANGSQCYAVNSMLITRCGNTMATCSSDSQCAFNTCVNGACEGVLSSSSTSLSSSTSTAAPTLSGFTTSITIIAGKTSSVLVNSAGATTSFGAIPSATTVPASGAGKVLGGLGGVIVAAFGALILI